MIYISENVMVAKGRSRRSRINTGAGISFEQAESVPVLLVMILSESGEGEGAACISIGFTVSSPRTLYRRTSAVVLSTKQKLQLQNET